MGIDARMMGNRIRQIRKERGLSAEELSARLHMAVESLGHIECGSRRPSLNTLYAISEILNVSLDYLTGKSVSPEVRMAQELAAAAGLTPRQTAALREMMKNTIPVIKAFVEPAEES